MTDIVKRVENFLNAEDEAVNALVLGGSPRETISGTVGRAAEDGQPFSKDVAEPVIDLGARVIAGQKDHCEVSAEIEAERRAALGNLAET